MDRRLVQREIASERRVVRIAIGWHRSQPVQCSAQDQNHQAALGWKRRKRDTKRCIADGQRRRGGHSLQDRAARRHHYLRWNSGLETRRASASPPLEALLMAEAVAFFTRGPNAFSAKSAMSAGLTLAGIRSPRAFAHSTRL